MRDKEIKKVKNRKRLGETKGKEKDAIYFFQTYRSVLILQARASDSATVQEDPALWRWFLPASFNFII